MNVKNDLADLFSLLNGTLSDFTESESFKRLEQETDLIRHIEPFALPEIKRLICCSNHLATQEWAKKYAEAGVLYASGANLDARSVLSQYKDVNKFENKILACVDACILEKFNNFFKELVAENNKEKKERKSLKTKITKEKKQKQNNVSQNTSVDEINATVKNDVKDTNGEENNIETPALEDKSKDDARLELLNKNISDRKKILKDFEKHASKTEQYLNWMNNIEDMDIQRQKAYKAVDELRPPIEEVFLNRYIDSGSLSAEDKEHLKNYGFRQRLIELFDKSRYVDVAFPVLARLYSDYAIDLESEQMALFISNHGRLLAEYLEEQYSTHTSFLEDEDNRVFIEYAIKETVLGNNEYAGWWNNISRATDWKTILEIAKAVSDDSFIKVATKLAHHVNTTSMDALMELLQSEQAEIFGITPAEFIIELVGQEAPDHKNLVKGYIRNSDGQVRKLQRKVASKEREINRHSQELFSALYQPIEKLEQLAVDLRLSDGEIKCSLVAGHVINALAELRERLSMLGLDTVDDIIAWTEQSLIDYDPSKHKMLLKNGLVEEQVKLQTIGFSYVDDEGNNIIRAAEVYIPAPPEAHSSKNMKTEQSNHISKRNKAVDTITSKKKPKKKEIHRKKRNVSNNNKSSTQAKKGKRK